MSDVRPSAQSDIPVGPSFGPVTYAPGYGPILTPSFASVGLTPGSQAYPLGPAFFGLTGVDPASIGHGQPDGLTVTSSSSGHDDDHHHHAAVPEPSSSLLLGLGLAFAVFAAWIKTRNK